jgi:hypothetical protein
MNTNQATERNIVKIVPDAWIASGRKLIVGIEQARRDLIAEFRHKLALPERLVRVAVNEAEALAWETEYPQLVFPILAEEKVEAISAWYDHGSSLNSNYAMAV